MSGDAAVTKDLIGTLEVRRTGYAKGPRSSTVPTHPILSSELRTLVERQYLEVRAAHAPKRSLPAARS